MSKLKATFLTILSIFLTHCGGVKIEKVKHYRLFVNSADSDVSLQMNGLLDSFNLKAGRNSLEIIDNQDSANSFITLIPNLQMETGKVGFGQWRSETQIESENFSLSENRTLNYSMNIEFDQEYFKDRINGDPAQQLELFKLFSHEIGHGLEMDHSPNISDVMYSDISGEKDFDSFFESVYSYLGETQ